MWSIDDVLKILGSDDSIESGTYERNYYEENLCYVLPGFDSHYRSCDNFDPVFVAEAMVSLIEFSGYHAADWDVVYNYGKLEMVENVPAGMLDMLNCFDDDPSYPFGDIGKKVYKVTGRDVEMYVFFCGAGICSVGKWLG
jgi:hypothetical protein